MSDHLTRLAARALGLVETVRPRRTLFEPQPAVPEQVARPEPDAEEPHPVPVVQPPPAEILVVEPEQRPEAARAEPVEPKAVAEPDAISSPPVDEPARAVPDRRPTPAKRPAKPAQALAGAESVTPAQGRAELPVERGGKAVARRVPLPAERTTYRALPPEREPNNEPPVVRVTIGRVDVKAVAPEPPAELRPRQKQPPRMSLEEYLSRNRSDLR